jgi:hypothetical protein
MIAAGFLAPLLSSLAVYVPQRCKDAGLENLLLGLHPIGQGLSLSLPTLFVELPRTQADLSLQHFYHQPLALARSGFTVHCLHSLSLVRSDVFAEYVEHKARSRARFQLFPLVPYLYF